MRIEQQHPPELWQQAIADAFDRGRIQGQCDSLAWRQIANDQIDTLTTALRFYADRDNYQDDGTRDWPSHSIPVQEDDGEQARSVLKAIEDAEDAHEGSHQ